MRSSFTVHFIYRWWNGNIPTELSDKEKKYGIFVVKKPNIYQKILKRKRKKTLMFLFANSGQNINVKRRQSAVRFCSVLSNV